MAKVTNILSNGRAAGSNTETEVQLPAGPKGQAAVQLAITAILAFYDRCKGENGYEAIVKAQKAVHGELLGHVFSIAKAAVELAGNDLQMAVGIFKTLCKRAEAAIQEARKDEKGAIVAMSKLLPAWASTKSQVLAGMQKKGVNPASVKDSAEFMAKARERVREGANATTTEPEATDFMTDTCAAAYGAFMEVLLSLDAGQQDKAADKLIALAKDLKKIPKSKDQKSAGGVETIKAPATAAG